MSDIRDQSKHLVLSQTPFIMVCGSRFPAKYSTFASEVDCLRCLQLAVKHHETQETMLRIKLEDIQHSLNQLRDLAMSAEKLSPNAPQEPTDPKCKMLLPSIEFWKDHALAIGVKIPRRLVVQYDVTDFSQTDIGNLAIESSNLLIKAKGTMSIANGDPLELLRRTLGLIERMRVDAPDIGVDELVEVVDGFQTLRNDIKYCLAGGQVS